MTTIIESLEEKRKGLSRAKKASDKGWAGLECPNYVKLPTVLCKKCGCTISEGRPLRTYVELRLVFDDNSAHVTPCCKKCSTGLTLAELEAMYCADLVALSDDEEKQNVLMHWGLLSSRKIVGYERV